MTRAGPAEKARTRVRVSVILLHWNTPELTARALASLPAAAAGLPYETIVVDNGSTVGPLPGSAAALRLLRNARNRGFAAAANQGAAIARGDFLLFLNSDAALRPGSMRRLLAALSARPALAAVAPTAQGPSGSRSPAMRFLGPLNQAAALLGWRSRRTVVESAEPPAEPVLQEVDWVRASTVLVRTEVFRAVCGFDEGYFFYEEDEDLCWRLRRRGWRVAWSTSIEATDAGGCSVRSAGDWPLEQLYHGQLRFVRRRSGRPASALFRLAVSVALVCKIVRRIGGRGPAQGRRDWEVALAALWATPRAAEG